MSAVVLGVAGCSPPGPADGGGQGGGDGQGGGGGAPSGPVAVLRPELTIDLAQVSSFFYLSGQRSKSARRDAVQGQGLMAMTLTGEVLSVSLIAASDGSATSMREPTISSIHATAAWIFFRTGSFTIWRAGNDGGQVEIPCNLVAARRADGALFCTELAVRSVGDNFGNSDGMDSAFKSSASGDLVYLQVVDPLNRDVLYRVTFDADTGPAATLVDATLHPNWFVVNAAGDLLVNDTPPNSAQGTSRTQLRPRAGGPPLVVTGAHNAYAIAGDPADPDRDTFYVVSGGGGGWPFDGTIRVVAKAGVDFVETPNTVTLARANCSRLFPLTGGVHMFCGDGASFGLARVIENGAVVANPAELTFANVDAPLSVGGLPFRGGGRRFFFLAADGASHKVVRHDGVNQQDIALDPRIELLGVTVSSHGDLDFIGVYTDTNQKVRGSISLAASAVTILSVEGVELAESVAFARIN